MVRRKMGARGDVGSRRKNLLAAIVAGCVLALAGDGAVARAAGCDVTNVRSHAHHDGLQAAVDAASAGDGLRVSGVCVGFTDIDRSVVVRGVATAGSGPPVLDGAREARVLQIEPGVDVDLTGLVIRNGRARGDDGGGILNHGRLTLTDVVVTRNRADTGGGIYSTGHLTLGGTTSIEHNTAIVFDGGGVAVQGGRLTMSDAASIHDNRCARGGGGLYGVHAHLALGATTSVHDNEAGTGGGGAYADFSSTLVLAGSSSIDHNVAAANGGGVFDNSSVTMRGSSTIADNVAGTRGGGVFVGCFTDLTGAAANGNVRGNHPSNVARESGCR